MTREEALKLKKAYAENPKLQALKKNFTEEEKTFKRLMNKVTAYTVKFESSKKRLNKLAGDINYSEHVIKSNLDK